MKKLISEENELDLYVLIKSGIIFLLKFKWIVLIAFLIGALIGWFRIHQQPEIYTDYYQSEFYVKSSIITDEMTHTLIANLNESFDTYSNDKFAPLLAEIKDIKPVKELSIDGLRSNIRVRCNLKSEQAIDDIFSFMNDYIYSTDYYKNKLDSSQQQLVQIEKLIQLKFDLLNFDLKGSNPTEFIGYLELVEKKQAVDKRLENLNNSLDFLAVEPVNKHIDTKQIKVLTLLGYGSLVLILTIFVLYIVSFFKRTASIQ